MKRALFIALILLVVFSGLILGPKLVEYDGYILLVMENGTLQMSTFGFLIVLLIAAAAGWLFWWCVKRVIGILAGSHSWVFDFSERKRQQAFTNGLIALAEGDYAGAQRQLGKTLDHDFDGINILAAAEAELQSGNPEKANALWHDAMLFKKSHLAALMNLVRAELARGNTTGARTLMEQGKDQHNNNPAFVKLWAKVLAQSGDWKTLRSMLPAWKKPLGDKFAYWTQQASAGNFSEIASKEGALELKRTWQNQPRGIRKDPAQRAAYIQQLINQGLHSDAMDALVEFQKAQPAEELLPLFRQLKLHNPVAAIRTLEGWLKRDDSNVTLLSVLGELALNSGDFVLAEKALGKAIKLANHPDDVLLMAKLKELQHDNSSALQLYKTGYALTKS